MEGEWKTLSIARLDRKTAHKFTVYNGKTFTIARLERKTVHKLMEGKRENISTGGLEV